MSEQSPQQAWSYPEDFEVFAIIVDGEVATTHGLQTAHMPLEIAAWSSDPKIVKIPSDIKHLVRGGWTFDGTNFSAPE